MSPRLNRQELAELKAHHLACSHLIKGCQDAVIRLRREGPTQVRVATQATALERRAVEILEEMLDSWCSTLSVLRANLDGAPPAGAVFWQIPDEGKDSRAHELSSMAGSSAGGRAHSQ
jgi:hypothetical protein